MDVRDKVVRAVETGTPRNKATSLSSVRTKRAHKLSDDIRDKVLKAVEGGMSCRQPPRIAASAWQAPSGGRSTFEHNCSEPQSSGSGIAIIGGLRPESLHGI